MGCIGVCGEKFLPSVDRVQQVREEVAAGHGLIKALLEFLFVVLKLGDL